MRFTVAVVAAAAACSSVLAVPVERSAEVGTPTLSAQDSPAPRFKRRSLRKGPNAFGRRALKARQDALSGAVVTAASDAQRNIVKPAAARLQKHRAKAREDLGRAPVFKQASDLKLTPTPVDAGPAIPAITTLAASALNKRTDTAVADDLTPAGVSGFVEVATPIKHSTFAKSFAGLVYSLTDSTDSAYNIATSEKHSSQFSMVRAANATSNDLVELHVPVLDSQSMASVDYCATFKTTPPSELTLQPCGPVDGSAQSFSWNATTGELQPVYTDRITPQGGNNMLEVTPSVIPVDVNTLFDSDDATLANAAVSAVNSAIPSASIQPIVASASLSASAPLSTASSAVSTSKSLYFVPASAFYAAPLSIDDQATTPDAAVSVSASLSDADWTASSTVAASASASFVSSATFSVLPSAIPTDLVNVAKAAPSVAASSDADSSDADAEDDNDDTPVIVSTSSADPFVTLTDSSLPLPTATVGGMAVTTDDGSDDVVSDLSASATATPAPLMAADTGMACVDVTVTAGGAPQSTASPSLSDF